MSEKLVIIEDIFFKTFIVGFILFIFSFIVYLLFNEQLIDVIMGLYGLKTETVSIMFLSFYGFIKIFLVFGFFVPAIGIHWSRKNLAKKEK